MLEKLKAEYEHQKRLWIDKHGQMSITGIAVSVVILIVVAAIGVFIADQIYDVASVTSGSSFYTAALRVPTIMNTAYSMLLVAVIAVIAGVIIAYLLGAFGGAGAGGGGEM